MLAFVSGASRGIGAACAEELAKLGFDVVINYRSSGKSAAEVAERIETLGRKAYLR